MLTVLSPMSRYLNDGGQNRATESPCSTQEIDMVDGMNYGLIA